METHTSPTPELSVVIPIEREAFLDLALDGVDAAEVARR